MCDLITLPMRLAVSVTRVGVQLTGRAVGAALHVVEHLVGESRDQRSPDRSPRAAHRSSWAAVVAATAPAPAPAAQTLDATSASPDTGAGPQMVGEITEPIIVDEPSAPAATLASDTDVGGPQVQVSEEPRLVAAFAEPGAEDGAGAAVSVREPWKGYGKMTASQIIARLDAATREELADVTLYESLHRRRRTVITAARRQLQRATAAASDHA